MNIKKFLFGSILALAMTFTLAGAVFAAHYTLGGAASIETGGDPGNAAQLVSDPTAPPGFSTVDVSPTSPIAWADLDTLSADYNVTDDDCGGGSPRYTLGIDTTGDGIADGNVHVAFGPSPGFTDCDSGWQSTDNLIGNEDAGRYDFSQFGGSGFTTYSNAPANVMNGDVVEVFIAVDASWSADATGGDSEQTILVDNLMVNDHITTFDTPITADDCKNGGWMTFTSPTFKNQGDCVSFIRSNPNAVGNKTK